MLYHEKDNFMPIMISPTFLLYVGIVQFLHSFFIISVQTNNPGDLANKLSLIARLLKTLHCNTIFIPREEFSMSVTIFFYWDSFKNVNVTNGSYRKVWRVWLNLYRYILFQTTSPQNFENTHVRKDILTFMSVNWSSICLIFNERHIWVFCMFCVNISFITDLADTILINI